MKTYKIFSHQGQKVAIKQGWSWPAFVVSWIWSFSKGLTVAGIIGLVFNLITIPLAGAPYLIVAVVFGSKGNKWWEAKLLKSGFTLTGSVQANNPQEAVLK